MLVRKPFSALVPTPQQDVTLFCTLTQPGPASETSDLKASVSSEGGTVAWQLLEGAVQRHCPLGKATIRLEWGQAAILLREGSPENEVASSRSRHL